MNDPDSPAPKALEEHRGYLHGIVRLKLHFVWRRLQEFPGEDLRHVLRNRVDIYRKTDINPGGMNAAAVDFENPAWLDLEDRLAALHGSQGIDAGRFEGEGFELFRATLDARCARDFAERPYVLDYKCGSLDYDAPTPEKPESVFLHIANANAPRSLFDPPRHLAGCLRRVIESARREHGAKALHTFTWLNSHPGFLAHFPPCWTERLTAPTAEVRWHFGWWGQFVNARGLLNEKAAFALRGTGVFPMPPRTGWCSFEELQDHLDKPDF